MEKLTTEQIRALALGARTFYMSKAIEAAREAANAAIVGMDDGGTCNFDAAVLPVGKGHLLTQASATVQAWAQKHGGSLLDAGYRGRGFHFRGGQQAATRTTWAETFKRVMEEQGIPMTMWYQMD